jgi:hypothetical protein
MAAISKHKQNISNRIAIGNHTAFVPGQNTAMKTETATEVLRRLSPDQIRQRLEAISAEERALRTLLRAAVRMHQPRREQKGDTR